MEAFARLFDAIDRTTSINGKVAALVAYLRSVPANDAAWALYFLTGQRLKRLLPGRLLHEWVIACTQLPEWLVEESYGAVGDYAETVALLLDADLEHRPAWASRTAIEDAPSQGGLFDEPEISVDTAEGIGLAEWIETRLLPLREQDDAERRRRVVTWWSQLSGTELLMFNKLLTGEFRVGVSRTLVVRAVAAIAALPPAVIEHRLMGEWTSAFAKAPADSSAFAEAPADRPSAEAYHALVAPESDGDRPSRPYPFFLASPLQDAPETLGDRADWLVEWKWDGIRAQLIHRRGQVFLWSRGEELLTNRFPEIVAAARSLPQGTVIDGEIVAFEQGRPRPFASLQRRIGRERRVAETAERIPVAFIVYDLLEERGKDVRERPLQHRRTRLGALLAVSDGVFRLSEMVHGATWDDVARRRSESRSRSVEGLMLKRWTSPYRTGRRRGDWWKWKIDPFTVDAVLMYAQPGSGRRATLFTDYTFGVWDGDELVPVAKAYSGLTDAEIDELDRWIRRHTMERFGPVSAVEPQHVFELGFERIARSSRHKSGVALRFPRMLRWRRDKPVKEADTLEALRKMMEEENGSEF